MSKMSGDAKIETSVRSSIPGHAVAQVVEELRLY
jgi:hypothetical protein